MTDLILFHHAQGCTEGVREFADQLRASGHQVSVPDLYDGATFDTLSEGIAHAQQVGFDTIIARGKLAAEGLPSEIVYAGFSLGVLPAQLLAQTRPGARGALLFSGCVRAAVRLSVAAGRPSTGSRDGRGSVVRHRRRSRRRSRTRRGSAQCGTVPVPR